jgi:hypothetical protein
MTVGIVGLGGGGSMVAEQIAHLGVGRIVAIDFDVVRTHNLSRIVGATGGDARRRRKKVAVAEALVARIDPTIDFEAVDGDIADAAVAQRLLECDFIFLATDTITSRLVANAIVQAHFLPMVQIGAKGDLRGDKTIESVYVAVRPVFPGHGCLHCAGLVSPEALQREAASDQERAAQNYLGLTEVIDPSVITLNGVAASAATNVMLMSPRSPAPCGPSCGTERPRSWPTSSRPSTSAPPTTSATASCISPPASRPNSSPKTKNPERLGRRRGIRT